MPEFYGHVNDRGRLETALPRVALLRGPASIGKRTLAEHLIEHHKFEAADIRRYDFLDIASAREIVSFCDRAPFGFAKVILAEIDGASPATMTTLLKLLEEPPPTARFILVASRPVMDTIISRSTLVSMGLLSEDNVYSVLRQLGASEKEARLGAKLGRGQVAPARQATKASESKMLVLQVLRALSDKDVPALLRIAASRDDHNRFAWGVEEQRLLQLWSVEAKTGRWRVFSQAESYGLEKSQMPLNVLAGLSKLEPARPALALRVALLPLIGV